MIPADAWNAFRAGQVDAWAVWSPFVEQAEITGVGRVLPGGSALIHSILAVRGSFAKRNRTTVEAIVDALNNTKTWMQQEPQMAQATVADVLDIPKEIVERAWPRHDWAASLDSAAIANIQAKADFLYERKYLSKEVNVAAQLVDTSYLQAY
jgi:sulfonate transport system substrate-binding protein